MLICSRQDIVWEDQCTTSNNPFPDPELVFFKHNGQESSLAWKTVLKINIQN